ncbi:MAG: hypothetical protein WC997_11610 [Porticoccaceae bacterium]
MIFVTVMDEPMPEHKTTQLDPLVALENLVRHGLEPDNPDRLTSYLRESFIRAQGLEPRQQRRAYGAVLSLLTETVHDRSVPFSWRCHCIDFAFEPALLMKSTAANEEQARAAQAIEDELTALRHCVNAYRQSLTCTPAAPLSGPRSRGDACAVGGVGHDGD